MPDSTDDFIYTVNQAAIILNKSDKTIRVYISEGGIEATKKVEIGTGLEKVFISARSLARFAASRGIRPNYDELAKITPPEQQENVFAAFDFEPRPRASMSAQTSPVERPLDQELRASVESVLRERIAALEDEKAELRGEVRELGAKYEARIEHKDEQITELQRELLKTTQEGARNYQALALAKEQIEARLTKAMETTRILHLSTNRDLDRLRAGKLNPSDLSPLPIVGEGTPEDFEANPPTTRAESSGVDVSEVRSQPVESPLTPEPTSPPAKPVKQKQRKPVRRPKPQPAKAIGTTPSRPRGTKAPAVDTKPTKKRGLWSRLFSS